MKGVRLEVNATITVSQSWASNFTTAEICQAVRDRLSSSLGFRGDVNRLKVKVDGEVAVYHRDRKIKVKPVRKGKTSIQ